MTGFLDRMLARLSGIDAGSPALPRVLARSWLAAKDQVLPPSHFPDLEMPLLYLSDTDPWRIRDAFEGTQIFGATGSGKTSGSGQAIAHTFLRAGFGGLVLCAKPDERERWERYAAECGRSRSVIVFDGSGRRRLNFLHYEMARQEDGQAVIFNLVHLLLHVLDVAEGRKTSDNREEPFWRNATGELLSNALEMIWAAYGTITFDQLFELIHTRPTSAKQLSDASWQAGSFWHQTLEKCRHEPARPIAPEDLRTIEIYWTGTFAQEDQRTPGNIVATLSARLHPLLKGPLRQLFSTTTNVVPEMTHEGAILLIDLPVRRWHEAGILAQQVVKYLWQRAVEARSVTTSTRPVFLWADECQFFLSPYDAEFQSTARSARAATVYLTQSLPTYYAQIGGRNPEHLADSLLGNFQTKIFHANGEPKSNQWAAELIGKSVQYRRTFGEGDRYGESAGISDGGSENTGVSTTRGTSASQQRNRGWGSGWSGSVQRGGSHNHHYNFGRSAGTGTSESEGTSNGRAWNWGRNRGISRDRSTNRGLNEVIDYEVQPAEFARLRKGGPEHGMLVDGIVFQGGRVWRHSRSTWLPCTFRQR